MKRHTLTFPIQMTKTKTVNPVFLIEPKHYRNKVKTIYDGSFGWDAVLPTKDMKVSEVWVYLLAEGLKAEDLPKDTNRTHFAGYGSNAGTIVRRGKDLGEMSFKFSIQKTGSIFTQYIYVRGYESPTQAEYGFINLHILPKLKQYISEHLEEFHQEYYAEALQVIKDTLVEAELQFTKFVRDTHSKIGA